jgi:ATP-binding cassette, subfamily B, bacterial PglK
MLKTLRKIIGMLSPSERLFILISAVARLLLVGLDIVGVGLLGVSVAVAAGTSTSASSMTGLLLQSLEPLGVPNLYAIIAAISVAFFCTKSILALLLNRALGKYLAKVEVRHSTDILRQITINKLELLDKWTPREVAHGLLQSSLMAFSSSITSASIVFGEIALIAGISIFLAITNALLFCAMALFFSIFGFAMHFALSVQTQRRARELDESWLRSQSIVDGLVGNFRQYVTSGTANTATKSFQIQRSKVAQAGASLNLIGMMPRYITEIALVIGLGLLVAQRSLNGASAPTPAVLAIFIAGAFRIVASMLPLQASFNSLKQIGEISKTAIALANDSSGEALMERGSELAEVSIKPPAVSFTDVSYSFAGGSDVVRNMDIEIEGGEFVAVVGKSGAGKSTFADLLLGLRQPSNGSVTIDGQLSREYVNRNPGAIGYVPQRIELISGTLAQNITMDSSREDYDDVAMMRAVSLAQLSDVVGSLPAGLNTILDQGLQVFSGGQLQRIALARALYRKPRLLVLDEATSALDSETEDAVREVIESLGGQTTLIVIAHRPATIRKATKVLKIEGGRALLAGKPKGSQ